MFDNLQFVDGENSEGVEFEVFDKLKFVEHFGEHYGGSMGLDIRLPIGAMFTLYGVLLVVYGLIGDRAIYQRSLGLNVNVGWGAVLLVFGIAMLVLGRRGTAKAEPADVSLEGKRMMNEPAERDREAGIDR